MGEEGNGGEGTEGRERRGGNERERGEVESIFDAADNNCGKRGGSDRER